MTTTASSVIRGILPPLLAFGMMIAAYGGAVYASGSAFFAIDSWFKWDGGHYFSIADTGYELIDCAEVPGFHPGQWCGNSGWFPGYPFLVRAIHRLTGYDTKRLALAVSQAFALGSLLMVWNIFLSRRNVLLLLLCAFAPGTYYFLVIFPMSMTACLLLLTLWAQRQRHYFIAFIGGMAAGFTYPTGVLLVGVIGGALAVERLGGRRPPARAWLALTGPIIGLSLVLLVHHVTVGHWNAFFLTQEKYKHGISNPWSVLTERLALLWAWHPVWWKIDVQSLWAAALVLIAAAGAIRARWVTRAAAGDITLALHGLLYWVFPLVVGGGVSPYRAESLLMPAVAGFTRVGRTVLAVLVLIALAIWMLMATEFAKGSLP